MSICTPCTKTVPVTFCTDAVHIGDWIAGAGVTVQIYWKNTATGRVQHEEITTGVDGKMTITPTAKMTDCAFEVWVNTNAPAMNEQEAFYLPDTTTSVTCLAMEFEKANTESDPLSVPEVILTEA
jgi:hypothetical protein